MGLKPWQKKTTKQSEISQFSLLLQPFYFLSITCLSLLLPLSFLLLSRLSISDYFTSTQTDPKNNFITTFFLYTNPFLLQLLVCIITFSSLINTITGRITLLPTQPIRPKLHTAWIFLCTLQVCVGLGIEASIEAGFEGIEFSKKGRSWFTRLVFFVGIHETMMHWCRSVVKPVVDDTLLGGPTPERWSERAVLAVGCGGLWWLRLRERVEALVGVVEIKMENMIWSIGFGDFLGWSLYYLVVMIGIARILKGIFLFVLVKPMVDDDTLMDVQEQV